MRSSAWHSWQEVSRLCGSPPPPVECATLATSHAAPASSQIVKSSAVCNVHGSPAHARRSSLVSYRAPPCDRQRQGVARVPAVEGPSDGLGGRSLGERGPASRGAGGAYDGRPSWLRAAASATFISPCTSSAPLAGARALERVSASPCCRECETGPEQVAECRQHRRARKRVRGACA